MWQFVLRQQKENTEELLKRYAEMATRPDDDLQTVRWKKERFEELKRSEISRRINELANVWLSTYFGNRVEETDYEDLQNRLSPNRFPDWSGQREQEWFRRAQAQAREKRFFHWELEFPEAFAGKEKPGFDIVIGNPPYVRQEKLGEDKAYFKSIFKIYHSIADLYVYFFERAHNVLRENGTFGFISSNKFMRSNYGKPLRNYLKDGIQLKQIIDFGELPVFPEAATFPAIYLTQKIIHKNPTIIYTRVTSLDFKSLDSLIASQGLNLSPGAFEGENWKLSAQNETEIMKKMDSLGMPLAEFVSVKINYGIKTGLNAAFIIDSATRK